MERHTYRVVYVSHVRFVFVLRLRSSSILVVGMQGLAAEVCKNIVLSGIRQLTVLDDKPVTGLEVGAKFLLLPSDIGKNVGTID